MFVMWLLVTNAEKAGHAALTRRPGGTCLLMPIAAAVGSLALATGPGPLLLRRLLLRPCSLLLNSCSLLLRRCSLLLGRMLPCLQMLCTLLELQGIQGQPCCPPGRSEGGLDLDRSLADGAAWRVEGEAVVNHLQQWVYGPWQAVQQVWQQLEVNVTCLQLPPVLTRAPGED